MDPHAVNYHSWTPYNYVANNPMLLIDPDGKDWVISMSEDENGNTHISFTITGKVINRSKQELTNEELEGYASRISGALKISFTGSEGNVSWSIETNITVADSEEDIEEKDHRFALMNPEDVTGGRKGGHAEPGSLTVELGTNLLPNSPTQDKENEFYGTGKTANGASTLERTAAHEAGHTARLFHPADHIKERSEARYPRQSFERGRVNLMSKTRSRFSGMNLIREQILLIYRVRRTLNESE